jgi:hypothetical protein
MYTDKRFVSAFDKAGAGQRGVWGSMRENLPPVGTILIVLNKTQNSHRPARYPAIR